ncbi:MAG: hypothetical protein HKM95_13730 [Inquilinus sp.]|nr:hypothetical protein [Inquilinus sp.]
MKKLVVILLVLLLLGGAGAGGWYFFVRPADDAEPVAEVVLPPPPPVYVRFNPVQLPLIGDSGIDQVIDIIVALEVADTEAGDRVIAMAPRINDAILQDLYGVLHTRRIMRGGVVDVTAIKRRIVSVAQGIMGEGVVIDALVQGVTQHPL